MSEVKEKILSVIGQKTLGVIATISDDGKPWARYVMVQADTDLTVHISTFRGSRKAAQIGKNPQVHITAGVASIATAEHYVQVQGQATISDDPAVKRAHWADELKAYFSGPDDPNYVVVVVKPEIIEYQTMGSPKPEVWTP